jgi:hypothetical protein
VNDTSMISPFYQAVLEEQRELINAQVRVLLKRGGRLEPADLMMHLRDVVGPIVDAIHLAMPERVSVATSEMISVSLELFEASQLGAESRSRLMTTLWTELLPRIPKLIARNPRYVLGCLCNGLLFVEKHGEPVASRWLAHLLKQGTIASDPDQLLAMGKFAAWVSGLAQYRQSALREASKLPAEVLSELLGASSLDEAGVRELIDAFGSNPWVVVPGNSEVQSTKGSYELIHCCAFRGFGGSLLSPPRVYCVDGRWIIADENNETSVLYADRYGWAVVHEDFDTSRLKAATTKMPHVSADGHILWGNLKVQDANLVDPTSHAFDGQTLAVTTRTSFHVYLVVKAVGT